MNWLATGSCEAAANLGWLVGGLGGALIDIALVSAICLAPRLREHGGQRAAVRPAERLIAWVPTSLVAIAWFGGLYHIGGRLLSCYASHSTIAATILIGFAMLIGFQLAATQIARRSVW
jgi:hypothetical protein